MKILQSSRDLDVRKAGVLSIGDASAAVNLMKSERQDPLSARIRPEGNETMTDATFSDKCETRVQLEIVGIIFERGRRRIRRFPI